MLIVNYAKHTNLIRCFNKIIFQECSKYLDFPNQKYQ